jgi:D-inositol-3-phosphate glycosyltransferase
MATCSPAYVSAVGIRALRRTIFRLLLRSVNVMGMSTVGGEGLSQAMHVASGARLGNEQVPGRNRPMVTLLTGGGDRPYALGIARALTSQGVVIDVIGGNELDCPDFHGTPGVTFLNLRGDQESGASFAEKSSRVLLYYARLIRYSATAKPGIFHILWNNKFEFFDRTLLMLYYKFLRKKIVLTAHNVNRARRDSRDTRFNRLTLRIQYRLSDHIFVHTEKMKLELIEDFGETDARVTVIPFGINNTVPNTILTAAEAKQRLGLCETDKALLFFGRITRYKGLEYLVAAFRQVFAKDPDYRLIIAGRPAACDTYWNQVREDLCEDVQTGRVQLRADFIPDNETEVYFKAADVLVLPYRTIYQSGVLFLAHNFGLPVLASDVGSFRDEIVEGKTGFVFEPDKVEDLARTIQRYFASALYAELPRQRSEIRDYTASRHSWEVVAQITIAVYARLLNGSPGMRAKVRRMAR